MEIYASILKYEAAEGEREILNLVVEDERRHRDLLEEARGSLGFA